MSITQFIHRDITIHKDLSDRVDAWCKEYDDTFSHFVRLAIRAALDTPKTKIEDRTIPETDQSLLKAPVALPNQPEPAPEVKVAPDTSSNISIPCSMKFCKNLSMGKFKVRISDIDSKEMYLCKFHLTLAKRESEVMEIAT
jgi:hypothetical protein